VLSLTRIGVAYADSTNNSDSQNYFFGTKSAAANLNQVLALLVGPKGDPGPAGVAGKDGLIGMDGKDGKDGLDGAPGVVGAPGVAGAPGASVLAVAFTGVQGTCTAGGVKLTDGAGTVTYTCNGRNGSDGAAGATGPAGAGGSGTGGTLGYGQGEVSVTGCEADNKMIVNFTRVFTGTDFVFNSFTSGNPTITDGDIKDTCASRTVAIYLKIKASGLVNTSGNYIANDIVKCSYTLPVAAGWPTGNPQFTLNSSTSGFACATIRSPSTAVSVSELYTADYTDRIGFEIG
jgi:hypothetical protein